MIRRLQQRLTRLRDGEAGLSMAELLVAAMLTTVMLIMVTTMFIQTAKLVASATQTRNSNGTASSISNTITAVLRTATTNPKQGATVPDPAIMSGSRNSLTVIAYADTNPATPVPIKVTYSIDADGDVWELRCQGVLQNGFRNFTGCGSPVSRLLGQGMLNTASDTLFSYRNGAGDPIVIGNNPLTTAQKALVGSITVTVKVRAPDSENQPVVITSTVVMRNLGLDTGQE